MWGDFGKGGKNMKKLEVDAKVESLQSVLEFIDAELEANDCSMKEQMKIDVAAEELFVNIAHYAYQGATGKATITVNVDNDRNAVISFIDSGVYFDPLGKEDPDVSLSANEREIGGLGIFMVKKSMDKLEYKYEDGQNITTITKAL